MPSFLVRRGVRKQFKLSVRNLRDSRYKRSSFSNSSMAAFIDPIEKCLKNRAERFCSFSNWIFNRVSRVCWLCSRNKAMSFKFVQPSSNGGRRWINWFLQLRKSCWISFSVWNHQYMQWLWFGQERKQFIYSGIGRVTFLLHVFYSWSAVFILSCNKTVTKSII